ncbi:MAG: hypothetical protein Kow0037_27630 [Calditrichia bacterium]
MQLGYIDFGFLVLIIAAFIAGWSMRGLVTRRMLEDKVADLEELSRVLQTVHQKKCEPPLKHN